MLIDESRNVVADVEDEPDRDEAGDAIKVNLQKIPKDVSIEKSHCELEFQLTICDLQYHFGHQMAVIPSEARNRLIIGLGSNASKYSEMFRVAQHDNDMSNCKTSGNCTFQHGRISK